MIEDPTHDCDACGNPAPWVGPTIVHAQRFLDGMVWPEYLSWTCRRCGNSTTKLTLRRMEYEKQQAACLPEPKEPKRSWWARLVLSLAGPA